MRPLIDQNVLLDAILGRVPWDVDAASIFRAVAAGTFPALIAAHTITNLFYVLRKNVGQKRAFDGIDECVTLFEVAPVSAATIRLARSYPGSDFEDNLQIACAVEAKAERIITRDKSGFINSPHPDRDARGNCHAAQLAVMPTIPP